MAKQKKTSLRILMETEAGNQFSYATSSVGHFWTNPITASLIPEGLNPYDPLLYSFEALQCISSMVSTSFSNTKSGSGIDNAHTSSAAFGAITFGSNHYLEPMLQNGAMTGSIAFRETPYYSNANNEVDDGLVLHYDFNDNATHAGLYGTHPMDSYTLHPSRSYDISGHGHIGHFSSSADSFRISSSFNPDLKALDNANALFYGNQDENLVHINGKDEGIVIPGSESFTVQFWVYRRRTNKNEYIWKGAGGITNYFRFNSSGTQLRWSISGNSYTKTFSIPTDTWTLLTLMRDGDGGELKIAKDNNDLVVFYAGHSNSEQATNICSLLSVDNFSNSARYGLYGAIANFKIYKRLLTDEEIKNEYNRYKNDPLPASETKYTASDTLKRYKFFGSKTCQVLGLPEDTWIYPHEDFNLSATGSEQTHFKGHANVDYLSVQKGLNISNVANITSDVSFRIKKSTANISNNDGDAAGMDRYLKFTHIPDGGLGFPNNDLILGYDDNTDRYRLKHSTGQSLNGTAYSTKFDIQGVNEFTASKAKITTADIENANIANLNSNGENVSLGGNIDLNGKKITPGSITGVLNEGIYINYPGPATAGAGEVVIGGVWSNTKTFTNQYVSDGAKLILTGSSDISRPSLEFDTGGHEDLGGGRGRGGIVLGNNRGQVLHIHNSSSYSATDIQIDTATFPYAINIDDSMQSVAINSSVGNTSFSLYVNGNIGAVGDVVAFVSDARLKENLTPISDAVSKITQLTGYTFNWNEAGIELSNNSKDKDIQEVGLLAQDVDAVIPEATRFWDKDNNDYKSVLYDRLVPLLVESIKEQQLQIDKLKEDIDVLKGDN